MGAALGLTLHRHAGSNASMTDSRLYTQIIDTP